MADYLVAFIDGETVGCAIARETPSLSLDKLWSGKTTDFPTFIDALQHYLKEHALQAGEFGFGLAVAGVPRGDVISLANCRWFVSVSGLRSFLRAEPLVLNDFAATAWSLTALGRDKMISVGGIPPRPIQPGGTFLCVGAGIGLGVAILHVTAAGEVVVLESEGGHGSFAPQNATEDLVLAHLRRQFGHVSYERVLSEPGLQNIYRALLERDGSEVAVPAPAAIIAAARHRSDALATEALGLFKSVLGSFIGSIVLTTGAWDGVLMTGELLRELVPNLALSNFRSSLTGKGRMGKMLEKVPISCVNYAETRLLGTAAALAAKTRETQQHAAPASPAVIA